MIWYIYLEKISERTSSPYVCLLGSSLIRSKEDSSKNGYKVVTLLKRMQKNCLCLLLKNRLCCSHQRLDVRKDICWRLESEAEAKFPSGQDQLSNSIILFIRLRKQDKRKVEVFRSRLLLINDLI